MRARLGRLIDSALVSVFSSATQIVLRGWSRHVQISEFLHFLTNKRREREEWRGGFVILFASVHMQFVRFGFIRCLFKMIGSAFRKLKKFRFQKQFKCFLKESHLLKIGSKNIFIKSAFCHFKNTSKRAR